MSTGAFRVSGHGRVSGPENSLGSRGRGAEYFDYINFDAPGVAPISHSGALAGRLQGLKRDHGVALVPNSALATMRHNPPFYESASRRGVSTMRTTSAARQ